MSASDRDPSMELVDYVSAITNQQSTLQQRFDALEEMASVWDLSEEAVSQFREILSAIHDGGTIFDFMSLYFAVTITCPHDTTTQFCVPIPTYDTQTQLLNNRKIRISIETYDGDEDEGSESDPASVIATAAGATKH